MTVCFPSVQAAALRMTSYRGYVELLLRSQARSGPAQQFLVRRVQGLEAAILRSAHV